MFCKRGSDSSSGTADRATASFISMMDNRQLRTNLYFIGTSNRYDLVDPAVIRKGRLGLHLEIAAMNTDDKEDILRIYLDQAELNQSQQAIEAEEAIVASFRTNYSNMTIAMIGDAVWRAQISADMNKSEVMTVEHFDSACDSLLDDKVDPQSRFRKLMRLNGSLEHTPNHSAAV